ncbi:MAG: ribose-phosphate pyrophosphokinase [Clostridia bacterium]|nr:ribose-phosphate pyrophosphokinase [Clostridia bacterium]
MPEFHLEHHDPLLTQPVAPLGIIALESSREMGQKINEYLLDWRNTAPEEELHAIPGIDRNSFLLDASCPRFANGEGKGLIRQSIRGYDLFLLVDVGNYSVEYPLYGKKVPMTPDEHFADLKRIINAAAGKARRINVIMPLLYEARQHRHTSRESLDCAVALQELQAAGVDNFITFDAHDPRVQNAVPTMSFENARASYQTLKAMFKAVPDLKLDRDHMMIVSPDEGGMSRNVYFASVLGLDVGMFYKRRDYTRIINGRNPIIAHEYIGADVAGKDIFIADDIISSGESVIDLARELKRRKARRIFVSVTYAFFTDGLETYKQAYKDGIIDLIFSTNLTYRSPELLAQPWYVDVDMSKYLALIIATLNHDRSLSTLLNPLDRIHKLMDTYGFARPQEI